MEFQAMVLDEVTGERMEMEERAPSTKPWDLPTLRDWEDGGKLAKETEMEQPAGAEGNPGEWCALEAKWHLGFVFFPFLSL